jgi:hypothetical protein
MAEALLNLAHGDTVPGDTTHIGWVPIEDQFVRHH